MSSSVLVPPNYEREFRLYVDSCDDGAGASLVQEGEDNIEHPISHYSRSTTSNNERNYAIVEKEALALLLGVNVLMSTSLLHHVQCKSLLITIHYVFIHRMKNDQSMNVKMESYLNYRSIIW